MQLKAEQSVLGADQCNINVTVPPTRSDVLHPCDVMEVIMAAVIHHLLHHKTLVAFHAANNKLFSFQGCSNCLWV